MTDRAIEVDEQSADARSSRAAPRRPPASARAMTQRAGVVAAVGVEQCALPPKQGTIGRRDPVAAVFTGDEEGIDRRDLASDVEPVELFVGVFQPDPDTLAFEQTESSGLLVAGLGRRPKTRTVCVDLGDDGLVQPLDRDDVRIERESPLLFARAVENAEVLAAQLVQRDSRSASARRSGRAVCASKSVQSFPESITCQ